MEKRVILAFALAFLVLYAFNMLYKPAGQAPGQNTKPSAVSTNAAPAPAASPSPSPEPRPSPEPQQPQAPDITAPQREISASAAADVALENSLYSATFSNAGGVLKSLKLKQYSGAEGNPLELIDQQLASKVGWPLALNTGNQSVDERLDKGLFSVHQESGVVEMEFASAGLYARKRVQFDPDNYELRVETVVSQDGKAVPFSVLWQGGFGDQSIPQDAAKKNALYQVDSSFKRVALRSLKESQKLTTARAGVEDQYFLAMFLSEKPTPSTVSKAEAAGPDGKPVPSLAVGVSPPEGQPLRVYVGPKQRDWLAKADPQLSSVIDFGYFGFIARPLVGALLWIHSYIGNFGWSIIVLTVVINLVIFPLRLKQQISMLKMQRIQPQMRRLQDQYKKLKATDPRRTQVQTEMMGLYKEHGVNPMGGCLPMLLQMPLLFGFYSALAYSIELRHAPWVFWINDLSQHDPYYVIPILMAVAMIVQQKLTPTATVDPAQARMMMIMPVMMTFLFLFYSSGLALYWLTSSVIGIGQQVFINKYWSPRAEAKLKTARSKSSEPRGA